MSLTQKIPSLLAWIQLNQSKIADNNTLFGILEGNVLQPVCAAIDKQLSGDSKEISKQRAVPINVLRKVVDKQTSIYSESPEREAISGSKDQTLLEHYEQTLDVDDEFNTVNESFNAYKYGVEEIFYSEESKELKTRTLPPTMFLPYGDDQTDPTKVTAMIKFMGAYGKTQSNGDIAQAAIYYIYSDDEFIILDEDGDILEDELAKYNIENFENPYGVIPFSYVSKSKYLLIPTTDTDQIAMSVLIPLLMTELNFGMMFLSNPIIVGTDISIENLQVSPMSFWGVTSDPAQDKQGKLDVLQPNMNIASQSDWIMEQTAVWLETKNIKANHLVNVNGSESVSSGIALIIREMDTTEDKKKQTKYFQTFESDFWRRFAKIHNYLADSAMLSDNTKFSDDFDVKVSYNVNQVIETTDAVFTRATQAFTAGVITKERALKIMFPEWSDEQVDAEVKSGTIVIPTITETTEDGEE